METTVQTGALKDREKQDLIAALQRHNGVQSRAAEELGITLRQMGYKVKIFGLQNLVKPRGKFRKENANGSVKNM
jgi:Nif-specific regulatory protein